MKRDVGFCLVGILGVVSLIVLVLAVAPNMPTINSPYNDSYTSNNWSLLNFSVTDPDGDNTTVYVYASNSSTGLINNSKNLVYIGENVENGSEVTYNLTALPVDPSSDGLVGLWHFDNLSEFGENDSYVYDFSGNGNSGTCSNCPIWNFSGKFGGAYVFDGANDEISIPDDSIFSPYGPTGSQDGQLSVFLWMRPNDLSKSSQYIFSKWSGAAKEYALIQNAGGLKFISYNSSGSEYYSIQAISVIESGWNYVGFVLNYSSIGDGSVDIYVNNVLVGSDSSNASDVMKDGTAAITIGGLVSALEYNGTIDEVAVWNRTLNSTEVANHYALGYGKYYWKVNVSDSIYSNLSEVNEFNVMGTINVTYPSSNMIFQRHNSTTGSIPIYGTYTGNPTAIEASFNGGPYEIIDSSLSDGIFSGQLNASSGNGTLIVRIVNTSQANDSVSEVGIGDVFVVFGQSNAGGYTIENPQELNKSNQFIATKYVSYDSWLTLNSSSYVWPLVANYIIQNQSIPIAFIDAMQSGLPIINFTKGNPQYTNMISQVTEATNGSMKVKSLLFFQGESDIPQGDYDIYKNNLTQMANDFINDTEIAFTVIVGQIDGWFTDRTSLDNIRRAQQDSWYEDNNISRGPITYDISLTHDGTHFYTDTEISTFAKRWWSAIGEQIYNLNNLTYPNLINITLWSNSTVSNLTLTFNLTNLPLVIETFNGTPGTNFVEGWRIKDGNLIYSDANITGAIVSNNQIILQLPYVLTNNVNVTYGSYNDAYNKNVSRDNSTLKLPIELIYEFAVIEINPPQLTITSPTAMTYTSSNISFSTSTDENSTCNYTLDSGTTNYSMTANATGTGFTASQTLSNAEYTCQFYCWDVANNLNNTENVTFTVAVPATTTTTTSPSGGGGVPTYTVSKDQLQEGYVISVGRGWKLKLDVENESHEVKVDDLTDSNVKITVSSQPQEATLVVGDTRKFELTNDSFYDLSVTLNSIKGLRADLTVRLIHEEITSRAVVEEEEKEVVAEEVFEEEVESWRSLVWVVGVIVLVVVGIVVFWKRERRRGRRR